MARKGNHQRNGLDRNHKFKFSESANVPSPKKETVKAQEEAVVDEAQLPNFNCKYGSSSPSNKTKCSGDGRKNKLRNHNIPSKEETETDGISDLGQSLPASNNSQDALGNGFLSNSSELGGDREIPFGFEHRSNNLNIAAEVLMNNSGSFYVVGHRRLRALALSTLEKVRGWLEKQKPLLSNLTIILSDGCNYVQSKTKHAYPIISRWLLHFGKLMLLLFMVWLDCCLRSLDSLFRLGTTSFFTVIWCSTLSVIAMVGTSKLLIIMVTAGLTAIFLGFTLAFLVIAIFATVCLWIYGSFWITGLFILVGGVTFSLNHERLALLITTLYAVYCAKLYVGWLGLLLGMNFAFISSDILIHFLKNNINEHRANSAPEHSAQTRGRTGTFYGEPAHCSPSDDRSPGVPSTSERAEAELTSEDEVARLLNCVDHYSALGLSRYENIDVSFLKREYRKKAMLVHPDKNMGNERAAEAFKKLQNAYEVLLDSLKRKAYDDDLRREELLNCFRKFHTTSQRNGRDGFFGTRFAGFKADEGDPQGDSRRIACKKCNSFHVWTSIDRSKSRSRWCQECRDFHHAKDGDGWVEQSFHPFLFGLLQQVDAPYAYVCAESRIYDATEWFVCQGMRCPPNTHKPSFHVNTSLTTKHNNAKGNGWANRGSGAMPSTNMEDASMTEEEFFEWLQNAMQSGMFEGGGSSSTPESPASRTGSSSKSSGAKKKRKGKKQW